MPNSPGLWDNGTLAAAVANGTLSQARLDDMAVRQLAAYYYSGSNLADFPALGSGMPYSLLAPHKYVNAKLVGAKASLLQAAEEGHVLVKNTGALPFKTPQLISLFGYDGQVAAKQNPDGSGLDSFSLGGESIEFTNGSWFSTFVFGTTAFRFKHL
jgi:beta-glucosidase